jgi:hypothetical protein
MMDAREARRERTLDYFEWQHRIDEGFLTLALWQPPSIAGLAELDGVLSRTSLHTLALWSLGTSPAAAGRRSWRSPPRRELDRHHAATTLSGRGWTRASE